MKTVYNFNALGQLSELSHFKQDQILDKYMYGYDVLGNKTSIEKMRTALDVDHGAYTYAYDQLNRLTEVMKDGTPLRNYSYDNFGNRLSMVENGVETHYTYNSINQLISSTDGKSYSYDQRGNLTQIMKNGNVINSYEFNPMNRLEKAINYESKLSNVYKYNGLNKRVGNQIGDLDLNPTKQINDVLDLTRDYHNLLQRYEDGVTTSYTYDFGLLSADNNPYLLDELGSPMRFEEERFMILFIA
ncbi:RHS repeat protein [Enterococcus faecium R499]|nr:RHS repeat protein [Enterococcus faecium R499]KWZ25179.1 hypothetical protein AS266_13745 [Enterococcus faecium]